MKPGFSIGEDWLSVIIAAALVSLTLAGIVGPDFIKIVW
jgi:hypothetical protein